MRLPGALIIAVLVVAVLVVQNPPVAAAESAAPASIGVNLKLLDAPVSGKDDPRAYIYIVDQLAPGTTITRHVRVTNSSATPAQVSMYPAAASISGGQFHFGAGHASNDLTSWTSVTPSASALTAGAATDATVRIAVPKDANGGEQYAVLWAEVAAAPVAGQNVTKVGRVGIRIYLDVSGTRQASKFTIAGIAAGRDQAGRPQITAQVQNTGQRAVDISGTIGLSHGPGGLQTGPVPIAATVTIAPGGTQSVSGVFDPALPLGPWLVTIKLASGVVHVQATATATFPAVAAAPVAVPIHHAHHSNWLWWVIGSVVVLLLALAVPAWLIRRRRSHVGQLSAR